ncbi:MAG TPA: UrcA family protein [Novosphingobium sp.]|nr:UrcA family protein [Novosphingobium sp.]
MTHTSLFALLLSATLPVAAHAQQASVQVSYVDLDLTSSSGVERLDNRIDAAVKTVCGDRIGQQPLKTVLAIRRCGRLTRADVATPRQIAIARARGQTPSVELASAGSFAVTVRRR